MDKERLPELRAATEGVFERKGWTSSRQVERITGLHYTLVARLRRGVPCGAGVMKRWAEAVQESPAKWIALANGVAWPDTTPAPKPPSGPVQRAGAENGSEHGEEGQNASPAAGAAKSGALVQFTHPAPPREVYDAIAMAETNEDKIQIAWDYIRRPELKLRFGAHRADRADIRLDIIRHYEEITGIQLLPPEVY